MLAEGVVASGWPTLEQARDHLPVNIGFGDLVALAVEQIHNPMLLEDLDPPRLGAYPIATSDRDPRHGEHRLKD